MCQYNYWGYDICCHEYESGHNQWFLCFLGNPVGNCVIPRHCPFACYTRHKIGSPYCDSCLDETPPSHPPVTEIIDGFGTLRSIMDTAGLDQGIRSRFSIEYRNDLRNVRYNASIAGVNNNFYNDVIALYYFYHQRMADAIANAIANVPA